MARSASTAACVGGWSSAATAARVAASSARVSSPNAPCPDGRQHDLQRQRLGDLLGQSQPPQARLGQHQRVVAALVAAFAAGCRRCREYPPFADRGGSAAVAPGAADCRCRRCPVGQLVERCAAGGNQNVARRRPFGHGRQTQPRRRDGRQVLEAVYGQIDAAVEQRKLDFLGENPLARRWPRSPRAVDRPSWRSGTISTSIPRCRNCAATHSACQRANALPRVPSRRGMGGRGTRD